MPESPLIEALKIALPMVFESQMETQLEFDNQSLLLDAFQYACIHRFPQAKIQFIVEGLFASDPSNWPVHQVLSVLRSMEGIRNLTEIGLNPLLEVSLQRLVVLVDDCKPEDLLRVMVIVQRSFSGHENRSWFNQTLCEKIAERIVRERWPLEATSRISWAFNIFPFVHSEFLEYLANLIVGCKNDASHIDPNLLLLFAYTSYKPRNLEAMMEVLFSSPRSRSIQILPHVRMQFI
jgi:FAST kinase domain-containing protein 2